MLSIFIYFIAIIQIIITHSFLEDEHAAALFLLTCGVATSILLYSIFIYKTDNIDDDEYENIRKKNGGIKLFIFSIFLYFVAVSQIVFTSTFLADEIMVGIFLLICGVATSILLFAILSNTNLFGNNKVEKVKDKDCGIISSLTVVVYFVVSFLTNAWHITWVIFLIGGVLEEIYENGNKNRLHSILKYIISLIIIIFVISLVNTVINFNKNYDIVTDNTYEASSINNVFIDIVSSDVDFYVSNSDQVQVVVKSKDKNNNIEVYNKNSTLFIENKKGFNNWFCFICINNSSQIEVYIPRDLLVNLEFNGVSGDFNTQIDFKKVIGGTVSGDFIFKNMEYLDISTTSGDIEVNNITEFVKINTVSGDVDINDLFILKDGIISTISGDVDINKFNNGYVTTDTLSGNVDIINNDRNAIHTLKISTISGDIEVN